MVVFSPTKGFFIGCEPAGFGGVEGDPEFSWSAGEALDLERTWSDFEKETAHHLGYISPRTPDAFGFRGTREELSDLAAVCAVHAS